MLPRVQIMVAGFKEDFIFEAIKEYSSKRLYLVVPIKTDKSEEAKQVWTIVKRIKKLSGAFIEVKTIEVRVFDFLNCFKKILCVVKKEIKEGNQVIFNVSTGTRIPVMAGYTVAMIEGCDVIHVIPEHYRLKEGMYAAEGEKRIISVPKLPLDLPCEEEKAILFTLRELGNSATSMKELVDHLVKKGDFSKKGKDNGAVRSKANYYINKLQSKGCLKTTKNGRETRISLTTEGILISESLMELDEE